MSFQWTVIAFVLYSEVALTILLQLPFISSKRWKSIVQSRFGQSFAAYANYYFNIFMFLLGLCFLDSIREIRKYHGVDTSTATNSQVLTIEHMNMKLFRAQRNFYIAGFALFLWCVLRRLVTLLLAEANAEEMLSTSDSAHREERETLEANIEELTERINRANEQAMAAQVSSDEMGRLATLQAAYDELEAQLEQRRQVESSGEGSDKVQGRQLQLQLNETEELLRTSERELNEIKMESEGMREELDHLSADYHELQTKYNTLLETGDEKKSN